MARIPYSETEFGFIWGPAEVIRCMTDKNSGSVIIAISSRRDCIDIHVSKSGTIRVFSSAGQWVPSPAES